MTSASRPQSHEWRFPFEPPRSQGHCSRTSEEEAEEEEEEEEEDDESSTKLPLQVSSGLSRPSVDWFSELLFLLNTSSINNNSLLFVSVAAHFNNTEQSAALNLSEQRENQH